MQRNAIILLCSGLLLLTGCFDRTVTVKTEYGKIRGQSGGSSVNGVSVLADMFRERGDTVDRFGRLSPRVERYDTLVWFPNENVCPTGEVIDRLEAWLQNGYERTLIYVGSDYLGEVAYYRHVADQTSGEQKLRALRALADAQLDQDQRLRDPVWSRWMAATQNVNGRQTCRWFERQRFPRETAAADQIEGSLAASLGDSQRPDIESQLWLVPRESYVDSYPTRQLETLLTIDQRPFVFRYRDKMIDSDNYWESQNQLIFVTNGSFLLNYGLVPAANRKLAANLIDQAPAGGQVLFLESDQEGIKVSDSDYEAHNQWAWITKRPLCYMVPHFLVWGVLFCFTFFPIFGRPRTVADQRFRSFGDHIAATARLLRRHRSITQARADVRHYLESGEASTKQHQLSTSSEIKKSQ